MKCTVIYDIIIVLDLNKKEDFKSPLFSLIVDLNGANKPFICIMIGYRSDYMINLHYEQ